MVKWTLGDPLKLANGEGGQFGTRRKLGEKYRGLPLQVPLGGHINDSRVHPYCIIIIIALLLRIEINVVVEWSIQRFKWETNLNSGVAKCR